MVSGVDFAVFAVIVFLVSTSVLTGDSYLSHQIFSGDSPCLCVVRYRQNLRTSVMVESCLGSEIPTTKTTSKGSISGLIRTCSGFVVFCVRES